MANLSVYLKLVSYDVLAFFSTCIVCYILLKLSELLLIVFIIQG